jgi:uncharacterized membrane protein (UPF0127 family)
MRTSRDTLRTILVSIALLLPPIASRSAEPAGLIPLSAFQRETLVVETRSARRHTFDAWRAETPAEREQGLMFVKSMRDDQAMIFVYEPAQYVAMWMKNTLLPLDMLFVDERGCVVTVKEHAKPGSLDTIDSRANVALVVELNGGAAAGLGLRVGDRVVRPSAQWPAQPDIPCTRSH